MSTVEEGQPDCGGSQTNNKITFKAHSLHARHCADEALLFNPEKKL